MEYLKVSALGALVFGLVGWYASPEEPLLILLATLAGFATGYFGFRVGVTRAAIGTSFRNTESYFKEEFLGDLVRGLALLKDGVLWLMKPHPFGFLAIFVGILALFPLSEFSFSSKDPDTLLYCSFSTGFLFFLFSLEIAFRNAVKRKGVYWECSLSKSNPKTTESKVEVPLTYDLAYKHLFFGTLGILGETITLLWRCLCFLVKWGVKLPLYVLASPFYLLWQVIRLIHSGERVAVGSYGVIGGASCHFVFSAWQLATFPHLFSVLCGMIVAGALAELFGRRLVRHPIFKFKETAPATS